MFSQTQREGRNLSDKMHLQDWIKICEDLEDAPLVWNRDDLPLLRKANLKAEGWFCHWLGLKMQQNVLELHHRSNSDMVTIPVCPLKVQTCRPPQTSTSWPDDQLINLCGHDEVEHKIDCLNSHINKFCGEQPQERVQKRKSDEKSRWNQNTKDKKRMMLIFCYHQEQEEEHVIIEDDKHSNT